MSTTRATAPADPDDDARRRAAEREHARANEAAARARTAETAPPEVDG